MRAFAFSAFLLQWTAIALAQDLTTLPKCAQAAAIQGATSSNCGTDATCLCNNAGFISSLKASISGSCTGSDQQAACAWGNSACAAHGVTIDCSMYAAAAMNGMTTTTSSAMTDSTSQMSSVALTSNMGSSSMMAVAAGMGTGSMTTTTSMMTSMTSMGSSTTMMMSTTMMSMTTSTTLHGNETMSCTHSCSNRTLAATSMMSKTASGPTSQYTGSANTAARHCGVIGMVAGVALLKALL